MFDMSYCECTDSRDHLFTAAGFCAAITPQIVVDHKLDLDEASTAFAQANTVQPGFEILCFAGIGYRRESALNLHKPSWTPD